MLFGLSGLEEEVGEEERVVLEQHIPDSANLVIYSQVQMGIKPYFVWVCINLYKLTPMAS